MVMPSPEKAAVQLHTVRDWLRYTVSYFEQHALYYGHGTDNGFDEAVWLLSAALGFPSNRLDVFLDAVITLQERKALVALIARRCHEKVPTAYLLQEAWLQGQRFYVDRRVIIPRSFIAELLSSNLHLWVEDPENITRVVDVGTGSGCLAIMAAQAFPNAEVDALEICPQAMEVARRNITDYHLEGRINLVLSDLCDAVPDGKCYDLMITNPPYVDSEAMAQLPAEYRHEPGLALAGGLDGLDHIHRLLHQARTHLYLHGWLIAEIGHNRAMLELAYPQLDFQWLPVRAGDEFVFLLRGGDLVALD